MVRAMDKRHWERIEAIYQSAVERPASHGGATAVSSELFRPCAETALAGAPGSGALWAAPFDVAPDGRFLFVCRAESSARFAVWANRQTPIADAPR